MLLPQQYTVPVMFAAWSLQPQIKNHIKYRLTETEVRSLMGWAMCHHFSFSIYLSPISGWLQGEEEEEEVGRVRQGFEYMHKRHAWVRSDERRGGGGGYSTPLEQIIENLCMQLTIDSCLQLYIHVDLPPACMQICAPCGCFSLQ